jgi:hypothetical protein
MKQNHDFGFWLLNNHLGIISQVKKMKLAFMPINLPFWLAWASPMASSFTKHVYHDWCMSNITASIVILWRTLPLWRALTTTVWHAVHCRTLIQSHMQWSTTARIVHLSLATWLEWPVESLTCMTQSPSASQPSLPWHLPPWEISWSDHVQCVYEMISA